VSFPFQNGVAVITGAAGGIGSALSLELAARGSHLALADRDAEGLAQSAAQSRTHGVKVSEHAFDITDMQAINALPEQVLAAHGRVNLLVNNAGIGLAGRFDEVSLEEFVHVFEINFWPLVRLMKLFLPILRQEREARIVNISSVFGLLGPVGHCAYAASKFAVRGISEVLRHELQEDGSTVGVTVVHPGGVRTRIVQNSPIAAAADQERISREREKFEKKLRLPPEKAAAQIVRGIERRRRRIVVGRDARIADLIQRLLPASYWAVVRHEMRVD
jgi:short-subunit dehydrogenase